MKCRQILFTDIGKAELLEQELPSLKVDDLLIKMEYTVVSAGTERDILLGRPNTNCSFPTSLGYCGVGYVQNKGELVNEFDIGDRVLVYHGYHADYCVKKSDKLTKVKDNSIHSLEAAFIIIAAISLGGLRKTRLEIGESILIMGQGILGIFATQLAKLAGALPVIAADPRDDRCELSLKLGADKVFSPRNPHFESLVRETTDGKGVNAVIEVSGSSIALKQALKCCATRARVSLLGCTRLSDCAIDYYKLVHRPGISLIGAHNFIRPFKDSYPYHWTHQDDCKALLKMISAKRLQILPVVSEICQPEDAPAIYKRLVEDNNFPLGIVFSWMDRNN
jgi:2-desacetyl-2-hydroxyethyl bacteriochlorophyllide A dehydrogenase